MPKIKNCFYLSVLVQFLVLTGISEAQAQNKGLDTLYVVGESRFLESEIIADRNSNRDDNGRLAAGLLIQSDLSGLGFDSNNGIIKTKNRPGETLLYLSPDEIRVRVYKKGYKPLSIILSDENIDLRKGKVWKVEITGTKEEDKIPVNIITSPEDAQIRIDGKIIEIMPVQLARGKHNLQIQRENYNSIDTTITVSEKKTLFEPVLQQVEVQRVLIESTPPNATIFIDNSPINAKTPHEFYEFPGKYQLTLSKEGYINVTEQITVEVGENSFQYNLLRNTSFLNIDVEPESAQILLNNEEIANGEKVRKAAGKYKLEVSADGYKTRSEVIDLQRDSTLHRKISLEQKEGDLQFSVSPRFANITLKKEGKDIQSWKGLKIIRDLPAGTYRIVAEASGHINKMKTVVINDNETANVNLKLAPLKEVSTVSLEGIPGSATIKFNGIGLGGSDRDKTFDGLPVNNESINYGLYEMVVKKEGFKPIRRRIRIDEGTEHFSVSGDFEPKPKFGSVMWSLFVPGGGQFYMGRSGRGFVYLLANAAAIGYTVNAGLKFFEKKDTYLNAMDQYRNADSDFAARRTLVNESYDAQQAAREKLMIGLGAVAGIKFIELLDNLFYPSPSGRLKQAGLDIENKGSSLVLRYNF